MNINKTRANLTGLLIASFLLAQNAAAQQSPDYSQETRELLDELGLKAQVTVAAIHENETLAGNEEISSYSIHMPSMSTFELGIELDTSEPQKGFKVLSVYKNSLAENLGLAANDRILIVNHFEVNAANRDVIVSELQVLQPGDDLSLLVKQGSKIQQVTMTVEENVLPDVILHVGQYEPANPEVSTVRESFPALEGTTEDFKLGRTSSSRMKAGYDKNLDFNQYKTFSFSSPTRISSANFNGLLALAFGAAIQREMLSRGYEESNDPDVLINVAVAAENKKEPPRKRKCPSYADYYWRKPNKYYRYSGRPEARLPESRITYCDYTEGTVTLEMVDTKQNRAIWKGTSLLRVDYKEREFLHNGSTVNPSDGSISVSMDGVRQRSTFTVDISRLSDEEINNGYLTKGYILDDVAVMMKGAPFRARQE